MNNKTLLEEILNLHSESDLVNCVLDVRDIAEVGWYPLHLASHEGLDELVEFLIRKHGAQANQRESNLQGRTSLMLACMGGHKKVVERLLLAGANASLDCL